MRGIEPAARSLAEALSLGPALLTRARAEGEIEIAASLVEGPAVVLGALQAAGRVVDLPACATAGTPVLRRATTGTAVYIGSRAVLWTLALPRVNALVADATPRTLLNRNVRGFLHGLGRSGAMAHYFGREWITMARRPAAVMGHESTEDGAALIEIFAGLDASVALPSALIAEPERALDRWLGKSPAALAEVIARPIDPAKLALDVMVAVAERAGRVLERAAAPADLAPAAPIGDPLDPVPAGLALGAPHRVPIGWIDTAAAPDRRVIWLGGDVLAPTFALRAVAAAVARGEEPVLGEVPLDGATLADLLAAARAAG